MPLQGGKSQMLSLLLASPEQQREKKPFLARDMRKEGVFKEKSFLLWQGLTLQVQWLLKLGS